MIKYLKGKKQFTKIVAFFMAVVMVVSVLYVSNSKSEVKAEGETGTICFCEMSTYDFDSSLGKAIMNNGYSVFGAFVPQIVLKVPDASLYYSAGTRNNYTLTIPDEELVNHEFKIKISNNANPNQVYNGGDTYLSSKLECNTDYYVFIYELESDGIWNVTDLHVYAEDFNYTPNLTYDNVNNKATANKYTDQYNNKNAKIRYIVDQNETATFDDSWSWGEVGKELSLAGSGIETGSDGTYYLHAVYYLQSGSDVYVSDVKTSAPCVKNTKTAVMKGGTTITVNGGVSDVALQAAADANYFSNGNPDKFDLDLTDKTFNWYDDIYINFVTEQAANELVIVPNRVSDTNSVWITYNGSSSNGKTGLTETYSFYVGSDASDKHADCGPVTNVVVKYNYTDTKPSVTGVKIDGTQYGGNAPFSGTEYYTDKDSVTFDVAVKNPSADRRPIIDVCSEDGTHKKEHLDLVEGQTEYTFSSMTYDLKEGINKITVKALNTKSTDDDDEEVLYSDSYQFIVIKDTTAPTIEFGEYNSQKPSGGYKDYDTTDQVFTSYLDLKYTINASDNVTVDKTYMYSSESQLTNAELDGKTFTEFPFFSGEITRYKDSSYAGKKFYDYFYVTDEVGNKSDYLEIPIEYYGDEIEISNVKIADVAQDKHVSTSGSNIITFDVTAAEGVEEALVNIDSLSSKATLVEQNGNVYSYQYEFTTTESHSFTINVEAKNKNGVTDNKDVTVLVVDLDDPEIGVSGINANGSDVAVDSFDYSKWYEELIIRFVASDKRDTIDSENFGVKTVTVTQTNSDGTTGPVEVTKNGSYYNVTVNGSTDKTGTLIEVEAEDKAGRKSTKYSKTFYVDESAPVIDSFDLFAHGPEEFRSDGHIFDKDEDPSYIFKVKDNIEVAKVEISGGASGDTPSVIYSKSSSDVAFGTEYTTGDDFAKPDNTEETYSYTLTVTDIAGRTATKTITYGIDTVAPTIEITGYDIGEGKVAGAPSDEIIAAWQKNFKLYVKITDANIDLIKVSEDGSDEYLELDDYNAKLVDGEYVVDISETKSNVDTLDETVKTDFGITVYDLAKNEASYSKSFHVDKTAPEVVSYQVDGRDISELPADTFLSGDPEITIIIEDNIAVASYTNTIAQDGANTTLSDTPDCKRVEIIKTLSSLTLVEKPDDGLYEFTLDGIKDKAGNSLAALSGKFTLDNSVPTIKETKYESNITNDSAPIPDVWYKNLSVTYKVSDGTGSGVNEVKCKVGNNEEEQKVLDSSEEFTVQVAESESVAGTAVRVTGVDKLNNNSTETFTYKVDSTVPVTNEFTVDGHASETTSTSTILSGNPTLAINITDNIGVAKAEFEITSPDSTTTTYEIKDRTDATMEESFSLKTALALGESDALADGVYTVKLIGYDLAGNATEEKSATFTVDNTRPTITVKAYRSNVKNDSGAPVDGTWYHSLEVDYEITDNSGISKIKVVNGTEEKEYAGADLVDNVLTLSINPSETISGTNVSIIAYDNSDPAVESEEAVFTYYVDPTDPTRLDFTVDGKPAAEVDGKAIGSNNLDPVIGFKITDNIKVATYRVDVTYKTTYVAGSDIPCTGEVDYAKKLSEIYSGAPDGTYRIDVYAQDLAGNNVETTSVTFTLDNTAPETYSVVLNGETVAIADIATREAASYAYKTLTFKANASDGSDSAGVASYKVEQYVYKNGAWTLAKTDNCGTDCDTINIEQSLTESGTKVVVTTTDGVSNAETKTYYFLVDNVLPVPEITVKDSAFSKTKESFLKGDPTIVSKDSDNIKVNKRKMTIEMPFEKDGSNIVELTTGYIGEVNLSKLIGTTPKDGTYTITIYAEDRSENSAEDSVTFVLDNTPPVNDMKITTAKPKKYDRFNFKSYDGTVYGTYYDSNVVLYVECADTNVDKITVTDNGEKSSFTATEGVNSKGIKTKNGNVTITSEGTHKVVIESVDKAGNIGASRTLEFVIDRISPVVTLGLNGGSPEGEHYLNTNANVSVSVTEVNKDPIDNKRLVKITRPSAGAVTSTETFNEGSNIFETEADYEVTYTTIDCAGNESVAKSVKFRVDKTAPELKITGVAQGAVSKEKVNVTYSMIEAFYWDMPSAEVKIYKKVDGQAEKLYKTVQYSAKNANSSMTETFEEDGEYRFEFTAEDRCGNKANTSYSFILDQNKPFIELLNVANYKKTVDPVTLKIQITEEFFSKNEVDVNGTRVSLEPDSPEKFSFKMPEAKKSRVSSIEKEFTKDGIYDITVTAKDAAGNESEEKIHFTIDTEAPILKEFPEYDGTTINSFKWDYENDKIVTDLTVCDVTVYLDGVEYDGISEITDGKHILKITAKDELGHEAEPRVYEFILDTKAPVAIITGIENGQKILEPVEINVSLQLDEDILDSVLLNGQEMPITNNTCTFTVNAVGDYEIIVKAHDAAGNTYDSSSVDKDGNDNILKFTYGKKFNPLWVIIPGGILLLAIILFLILRKKDKKEEKRLS